MRPSQLLTSRRLPEGLTGIQRVHELIAERTDQLAEVVIGIATDRGLWAAALVAADYPVKWAVGVSNRGRRRRPLPHVSCLEAVAEVGSGRWSTL